MAAIKGLILSRRQRRHRRTTRSAPILEDMDELPFVTPVYKRDLTIEKYFGGYLKHPYISFYTGRGCKSRCTFCLWPQTIGGHKYRMRSVAHVVEEVKWAKKDFPEVKEFFFDDDTLTDNLPRVEELARELGKLGVDLVVQRQGQCAARDAEGDADNGLRLLLVGYEIRQPADPAQHQEGHADRRRPAASPRIATSSASSSTAPSSWACRARPTRPSRRPSASPRRSIRTRIQVSLAAPYPGTFLYKQAMENGWFDHRRMPSCSTTTACQIAPLQLPASQPHRDLPFGRGVLQALLFPRAARSPRSSRRWRSARTC